MQRRTAWGNEVLSNLLRRLLSLRPERVNVIADPACEECFGRGFDAGGQQCVCVREIRVGRNMADTPDGPELVACGECGTISSRARFVQVTPTIWVCGPCIRHRSQSSRTGHDAERK